jgi:hypothetical protein
VLEPGRVLVDPRHVVPHPVQLPVAARRQHAPVKPARRRLDVASGENLARVAHPKPAATEKHHTVLTSQRRELAKNFFVRFTGQARQLDADYRTRFIDPRRRCGWGEHDAQGGARRSKRFHPQNDFPA